MTDATARVLVFKDEAGDYFLLPQEVLECGRVPKEHEGELERLVSQHEDVHGYAAPIIVAIRIISLSGMAGFSVGAALGVASNAQAVQVPTIDFPPSQETVR
jgi:hypothetical protein